MKKQLLIIGIAVLLICVGLSGCLSSEGQKLIGRWSSGGGTMGMELNFYTEWFSKKVDYYTMGVKYTLDWNIDNGKICLSGDASNIEICWGYSFTDEDTLNVEIITGMLITLNRVK